VGPEVVLKAAREAPVPAFVSSRSATRGPCAHYRDLYGLALELSPFTGTGRSRRSPNRGPSGVIRFSRSPGADTSSPAASTPRAGASPPKPCGGGELCAQASRWPRDDASAQDVASAAGVRVEDGRSCWSLGRDATACSSSPTRSASSPHAPPVAARALARVTARRRHLELLLRRCGSALRSRASQSPA
jgi:hypothetical protein